MLRSIFSGLGLAASIALVPLALDPAAMAQGYQPKGPPPSATGPGPMSRGVKGVPKWQPKGPLAGAAHFAVKDQGPLRPGPVRWVDMHMHLVPARGDFSGAVREALGLMDRAGIETAVLMPTGHGLRRTQRQQANPVQPDSRRTSSADRAEDRRGESAAAAWPAGALERRSRQTPPGGRILGRS